MEKVIAVIGAMDEEIERLLPFVSDVEQDERAGILFYRGYLSGKRIILCKSGVGKVNASVCTQLLITHFGATHVIFTGVAGAVDPDLEIGDIVISSSCLQHDMDASALGFDVGVIPFAPVSHFKADTSLMDLAQRSSKNIDGVRVVTGKIVSGDQFIADRSKVRNLYEQFEASCTEMEGAAVAQVCHMNQVPFVIIRSLSDKADGSAHINFEEFTHLASQRSQMIVEQMLKQI